MNGNNFVIQFTHISNHENTCFLCDLFWQDVAYLMYNDELPDSDKTARIYGHTKGKHDYLYLKPCFVNARGIKGSGHYWSLELNSMLCEQSNSVVSIQ